MSLLAIVDWSKHYENNRTRGLKYMEWVPIKNRMDGLGYRTLIDHPNGAAHFGAWIAIIEVCSRQKTERGSLPQEGAELCHALERATGLPRSIFEEVLPRLVQIGWIQIDTNILVSVAQVDVTLPHEDAEDRGFFRSVSVPVSVSVTQTNQEENSKNRVGEILDVCERIYREAGVPVAPKHRQLALQMILNIPDERRPRLPAYIRHCLESGRWSDSSTTKGILNVLRDGDWDVEITPRTIPKRAKSREDDQRAEILRILDEDAKIVRPR